MKNDTVCWLEVWAKSSDLNPFTEGTAVCKGRDLLSLSSELDQ